MKFFHVFDCVFDFVGELAAFDAIYFLRFVGGVNSSQYYHSA